MNLPRKRLFWAVGLGHLINDTFISMGPVLLAFLSVTILPMSNFQIGLAVSATQLVGAITQPFFGLIADRTGGRWQGSGGVLWTISLTLLAMLIAPLGSYALFIIPFVAAAIGSGAFHPVGAMHAADSDKSRTASNMAYFFLMGQFGLALGPAVGGLLLDLYNRTAEPLYTTSYDALYGGVIYHSGSVLPVFGMAVFVVPIFLFMLSTIPISALYRAENNIQPRVKRVGPRPKRTTPLPVKAFAVLGVMVALRSLGQPGAVAFIPVLFQDKGWTPAEYGAITSSYWFASGIAGVLLGSLADRFDRRWVVALSMIVSAPGFFFLPVAEGGSAFAMAILAGGLSGGSHSIIVVLAQELIPAAKGFASGAILGFIFGMGALGSALIGTVSDSIGLGPTFQIVAATVAVAGVIALWLPARQVKVIGDVSPAGAS
ncbi:MAG: MFS transporter [Anaerolineae bacterium]